MARPSRPIQVGDIIDVGRGQVYAVLSVNADGGLVVKAYGKGKAGNAQIISPPARYHRIGQLTEVFA
jgi:hypothetical protein